MKITYRKVTNVQLVVYYNTLYYPSIYFCIITEKGENYMFIFKSETLYEDTKQTERSQKLRQNP